MRPAPGVDSLKRVDGRPVELIRANVREGVMADSVVFQIEEWLASQSFDPAIEIRFRGANEEQADSMAFRVGRFYWRSRLCLSCWCPSSIISTRAPDFARGGYVHAGVLLGLLVLGSPFSALLTGVGVVALAGIVVNNNIILIDTFNHVRASIQGWIFAMSSCAPRPSVCGQCYSRRLLPCGLLPLAAGFSVDLAGRSITAEGNGDVLGAVIPGDRIWLIFCHGVDADSHARVTGPAHGHQDAVFDGQSPIGPGLASFE